MSSPSRPTWLACITSKYWFNIFFNINLCSGDTLFPNSGFLTLAGRPPCGCRNGGHLDPPMLSQQNQLLLIVEYHGRSIMTWKILFLFRWSCMSFDSSHRQFSYNLVGPLPLCYQFIFVSSSQVA